MTLGRLFFFGLAGVAAVGCGDDPIPLQVDFQYTSFCEFAGPPAEGCPEKDHDELVGKNGAAIPTLAGASIGLECEIVKANGSTVLTSLKVQDNDVNVTLPDNGLHITNGIISVGSSVGCPAGDGVQFFEDNEFNGGCAGLTEGNCAILVNDYSSTKGRLVLEIECTNLLSPGGTHRSIQNGILTIQGCNITEDNR